MPSPRRTALCGQNRSLSAHNVPIGHGPRAAVDRGFLLILDVTFGGYPEANCGCFDCPHRSTPVAGIYADVSGQ